MVGIGKWGGGVGVKGGGDGEMVGDGVDVEEGGVLELAEGVEGFVLEGVLVEEDWGVGWIEGKKSGVGVLGVGGDGFGEWGVGGRGGVRMSWGLWRGGWERWSC